ncbi:kinase-like protein [Punctularia strigosozonata HHB-11173 SS5]|uniref:kinase-like protein n=1 Tax=Punctularia strigosozonata (strain HHB-11173) TaxID=741275 RepID=UPI00044182DD|nr:kinase-like protein [Punctularia strigosozonata HHB-11173 SS5]EIN14249.1 kinase-like protein [Punctularia strigosozonata HHB-11173 SS5]
MVRISNNLPNFTGRLVGGRYSLREVLGSGAYGIVHRAEDREAGSHQTTQVAVKCLWDTTNAAGASHRREVAIHKLVSSHGNILTLRDIVYEEQFIFIVLDLMQGGDLFGNIVHRRVFWKRDDLIRNVFLQICDGVQHSHSKGIAHRDLKPENILCSPEGNVVIGDWGLATRSSLTENRGCGSAFYMSPEAFKDAQHPRLYCPLRSDIWSLGIILINLITGRCPWQRAERSDTSFIEYVDDTAHGRWNGEFLRCMLPLSSAVNILLKRILVVNPAHRLQIQDIKERILNIDTFFMSPDDVSKGTQHVKGIVEEHAQFLVKAVGGPPFNGIIFAPVPGTAAVAPLLQRETSMVTVAWSFRSRSNVDPDAFSRSSRPSSPSSRGPRTPPVSDQGLTSIVIASVEQAHPAPAIRRPHPLPDSPSGTGSPSAVLLRMAVLNDRPQAIETRSEAGKRKRQSSISAMLNKTIKCLKALA